MVLTRLIRRIISSLFFRRQRDRSDLKSTLEQPNVFVHNAGYQIYLDMSDLIGYITKINNVNLPQPVYVVRAHQTVAKNP